MGTITSQQAGWLTFLVRITVALLLMPSLRHVTKGPDAWIGIILGSLGGSLVVWFLARSALRFPHLTLIGRLKQAFGPTLGSALGLLFLLRVLVMAANTIRGFASLLIGQPMPETPGEAFFFLTAVGGWYAARRGVEAVARIGELLGLPILLLLLLLPALGFSEMQPSALMPVLGYGWGPPLRAAIFPFCIHLELLVLTMLVPYVRDRANLVRAAVSASLAGGALIALIALAITMFYSAPSAARLTYPLYDLIRSINVAEVLQRLDALFLLLWAATVYVNLALFFWIASVGFAELAGVQRPDPLLPALTLLLVAMATKAYEGIVELTALESPPIYPWTSLPFLLGLPLLLALVEALRPRAACEL